MIRERPLAARTPPVPPPSVTPPYIPPRCPCIWGHDDSRKIFLGNFLTLFLDLAFYAKFFWEIFRVFF